MFHSASSNRTYRTALTFTLIVMASSLQGCGASDPDCGGSQTKKLIERIAKENRILFGYISLSKVAKEKTEEYIIDTFPEYNEIKKLYKNVTDGDNVVMSAVKKCGGLFEEKKRLDNYGRIYCEASMNEYHWKHSLRLLDGGNARLKDVDLSYLKKHMVDYEVIKYVEENIKPNWDKHVALLYEYEQKVKSFEPIRWAAETKYKEEALEKGVYSLLNIRMVEKNDKTKAVLCQASLELETSIGSHSQEIVYSIELTSEKNLYGTIYERSDRWLR